MAVREALDRRDVKLNGKRVDRQAMLVPGAEVRLYTPGEEIREREIPILYEDRRVLIVRKPVGVSCQPDGKGGLTLPELVGRQLRRKEPDARDPLLCHRLDNQTMDCCSCAGMRKHRPPWKRASGSGASISATSA